MTYPRQISWLEKVFLPSGYLFNKSLLHLIPLQQVPLEAPVAAEKEIASSRLSLEEEIDQFRFVEDMRPSEKLVDISDSGIESVNLSSVHPKQLIITRIDSESEEEEEQMD